MRDLLPALTEWFGEKKAFAVALVTAVEGSSPQRPGAMFVRGPDGEALGGISGGCLDATLYELAGEVLADGRARAVRFDSGSDDLFEPGLLCGGSMEVLVRRVDPGTDEAFAAALASLARGAAVTLALTVDSVHPERLGSTLVITRESVSGTLGAEEWDRECLRRRAAGDSGVLNMKNDSGEKPSFFLYEISAPPRMLLYGAVDFARALSQIGAFLGYHVTVCDARAVFAIPERFPYAHEIVVDQPARHLIDARTDRDTVVVSLTHDPKFDIPLLCEALRRPLAYVGAIGSRHTCAKRSRSLIAAGVTERQLARLRAPVGLDLGGRGPEETALSIAAEVVAVRHDRPATPLRTGTGPLHAEAAPACGPLARPLSLRA
ncbi:XdhC family protein [Streptomyces sp. NPDC060065]|uniref:XdhC family protein n=1 Tax=Streptomyces sp. NPDC060065 TaxID=3347050 RepID=UPI00367BDE32